MQEEQNVVKQLETLLLKKQGNDEKVSKELLETKYKKSYMELKKNIVACINKIAPEYVMMGFRFNSEDKDAYKAFSEKAQKIIDEEMTKGLGKTIRETAYTTYNLSEILKTLLPLHSRISKEAYMEYWLSKCSPCTAPGYSHYNSIINMYYSEESKVWMAEEDGKPSFTIMYPPTEEEYLKSE